MSRLKDLIGLGFEASKAEKIARRTIYCPSGIGHVGATAGFTNAADTGEAQCPASQTAATFIIPITGLAIGDTIESFTIVGQVESGGNTATVDCSLRRLTNAASDPTDASLGAITQVSETSDATFSSSKTLATEEVLATGEMIYALITVTTGVSTDVRLLGIEVKIK